MELKTRIAVGDYHLAFQSSEAGEPTVVFESGGDCGADSLANLARRVQTFTRTLIYDRAGLGASDPAPCPRTIQDAVDNLHTLLHAAQIPGPYLLVGHSLGGLIVRLYTAQHAHEVMGLVLLDVPHPEQALRELRLVPSPLPQESPVITAYRNNLTAEWTDPFSNREGIDRAKSAAQIPARSHLGDLPLVVITAGIDEWEEGFPAALAQNIAVDWMRMQQELLMLSNNSTHIVATQSTHSIQDCQPELVVDAIYNLVEKFRTGSVELRR